MKIEVELNNLSKKYFQKKFFKNIFEKTFFLCQKEFSALKDKKIFVSVAILEEVEIKKINKIYRKKNSATDVLSFSEYKNKKELIFDREKEIFLGEIILCYNYIERHCQFQEKAKTEMRRVVSHGLLHLLGFRHSKKMFEIQEKVIILK